MKDQLFLLRPGFVNGDKGPYYCGDSVSVEGLLSFFPALRDKIEVHYIEFPKPRGAVVALIGADNQSIPVLVLSKSGAAKDQTLAIHSFEGKNFINQEADIRKYLSSEYELPIAG